jgi:prophage regulatory protein
MRKQPSQAALAQKAAVLKGSSAKPALSPSLLAANEAHIAKAALAADRPHGQHDRQKVYGARGPPADPDDLILLVDLQRMLPLSRSTIWRLERDGRFPRRILISAKRVAWRRGAIQAWIAQRTIASTPSFLNRLLQEIAVAEDEAEDTAILDRYADELDALPPNMRQHADELIEDAVRERRR